MLTKIGHYVKGLPVNSMQGTSLKLGSIGITSIYVVSQEMSKACKKTFQLLFMTILDAVIL